MGHILTSYIIPTAAGVALMGIPYLWCRMRHEDPESYGLSWEFDWDNLVECLLITAVLLIPLTLLSIFWPAETLPRYSTFWRSLNLAAAGVSAAVIEEIFYRGWLLPLFRKRFSAFFAIMFTSLIFALSHIFVAQTPFLFAVFFPGCIMGLPQGETRKHIDVDALPRAGKHMGNMVRAPPLADDGVDHPAFAHHEVTQTRLR